MLFGKCFDLVLCKTELVQIAPEGTEHLCERDILHELIYLHRGFFRRLSLLIEPPIFQVEVDSGRERLLGLCQGFGAVAGCDRYGFACGEQAEDIIRFSLLNHEFVFQERSTPSSPPRIFDTAWMRSTVLLSFAFFLLTHIGLLRLTHYIEQRDWTNVVTAKKSLIYKTFWLWPRSKATTLPKKYIKDTLNS
ncbi:hypothetical protein AUJ77_03835 [Candidatus Nomurabacteria bacterium CG1_02_43_90]|uniref:Uncharacterized protein n=1 Tax=Candidatus Nomurabacteria bacterium CG1_02_43_90 TaxID=1805281 RepID=A0A1J4UZ84_9BACT|nr:MAG: hypothetical protein AUJ77_03835 [Candidatus Nomurabacteria bacterium CG1_02_43_90]